MYHRTYFFHNNSPSTTIHVDLKRNKIVKRINYYLDRKIKSITEYNDAGEHSVSYYPDGHILEAVTITSNYKISQRYFEGKVFLAIFYDKYNQLFVSFEDINPNPTFDLSSIKIDSQLISKLKPFNNLIKKRDNLIKLYHPNGNTCYVSDTTKHAEEFFFPNGNVSERVYDNNLLLKYYENQKIFFISSKKETNYYSEDGTIVNNTEKNFIEETIFNENNVLICNLSDRGIKIFNLDGSNFGTIERVDSITCKKFYSHGREFFVTEDNEKMMNIKIVNEKITHSLICSLIEPDLLEKNSTEKNSKEITSKEITSKEIIPGDELKDDNNYQTYKFTYNTKQNILEQVTKSGKVFRTFFNSNGKKVHESRFENGELESTYYYMNGNLQLRIHSRSVRGYHENGRLYFEIVSNRYFKFFDKTGIQVLCFFY